MRKFLSVLMVLLMVLGTVVTAFATEDVLLIAPAPYRGPVDVKGTIYEDAVIALMDANVVTGYPDQTYRPDNTLTRAEACAFLVNYLAPTEEERNAAPDSGFTDVSGWATTFVNYAVDKGIVAGYTDGTFRPGNQVNYQEMAAMTVNALGIKAEDLVGKWPDAYINKAKDLGMYESISVTKKNTDQANRGDVALMVYSLMKYKDKTAADTIVELLTKSDQAFQEASSMSYEMLMELSLTMEGETMENITTMKMDLITSPMAMYVASEAVAGDEVEHIEYYYVTEGEELVMYMLMKDQWYRMSMGSIAGAARPTNPSEELALYLKAYDHLRIEGKDLVGEESATKVYCEIATEYVDDMMEVFGIEIPETEDEAALIEEAIKEVKGFGYHLWIDDETGVLTKIHMDLSGLTEQLLPETLDVLRFDTMMIEMVVTNMNRVESIQLPTATKKAIDLGGTID